MNTNDITPVLLLTGYLGSGKTTLLNHILTNERGIRFAVIVNDIGEVNIDETLIRKGGIVGADDSGDLIALQNGCICCTLKMDLMKQLTDLTSTGDFDYIVIEASGICEPEPIAQTICSIPGMPGIKGSLPVLDCIITVVDALRLKSEFGCGDDLNKPEIKEEDIENLIIQQIEFCNIVLLNKISEVSREETRRITEVIHALNPGAEIIECDYADVDIAKLVNTRRFDFEKTITSAAWVKGIERAMSEEEEDEAHHHHHHHDHDDHHHEEDDHDSHDHHHHHHHHHHHEGEAEEYGIQTFVYYRRAPFNFNKFDRMIATAWPQNIIRAKGVLYFGQNRDMSLLFEQAGVQKKLTEAGYWYATAPEADLEILMEREPGLRRDWDDKYGDRMDKIVIIGRNLDKKAICELFDSCLEAE